jgi:hypothetical protein
VLLTSNDEAVALSVHTILLAGSILKSEICSCSDRPLRTDYDLRPMGKK